MYRKELRCQGKSQHGDPEVGGGCEEAGRTQEQMRKGRDSTEMSDTLKGDRCWGKLVLCGQKSTKPGSLHL